MDTAGGFDVDADGFDSVIAGGADCDDTDALVNPAAEERCDNLVDDDCDGETDEECTVVRAGPPDPGGISWTCSAGAPSLSWALIALCALLRFRR